MVLDQPAVTVCCITYNHEAYIEDALKGFLMQKTAFPFEIIIHDDASTDATSEILIRYRELYPNIVKPIIRKSNVYSKGIRFISIRYIASVAAGKYLAFCEGDDFWLDPQKLQNQYDIMQKDNSLSFCAHSVRVLNDCEKKDSVSSYSHIDIGRFSFESVVVGHSIPTLSIFCKNIFDDFFDIYHTPLKSADKAIIFYLLSKGDGYFENGFSGVYRDHDGGVTKDTRHVQDYVSNFEVLVLCSLKIIPNSSLKLLRRELALVYLIAAKRVFSTSVLAAFLYLLKSFVDRSYIDLQFLYFFNFCNFKYNY